MTWHESWPERFFWILLAFGLFIALGLHNAFLSNVVMFLMGLLTGRIIYERRKMLNAKVYLIIIGFVIGYLIGDLWGNAFVTLGIFLLANCLSYILHMHNMIDDLLDQIIISWVMARDKARQRVRREIAKRVGGRRK